MGWPNLNALLPFDQAVRIVAPSQDISIQWRGKPPMACRDGVCVGVGVAMGVGVGVAAALTEINGNVRGRADRTIGSVASQSRGQLVDYAEHYRNHRQYADREGDPIPPVEPSRDREQSAAQLAKRGLAPAFSTGWHHKPGWPDRPPARSRTCGGP